VDKYQLIKEIYFNQIGHKDSLNSKISIPITIESVLVVTLAYYIKLYNKIPLKNGQWVGVFRFLVILLTMAIIMAIVYSYKSFTGFTYDYLTTDIVIETEKEVKEYYDENYERYFFKCGKTKKELIELNLTENLISTMDKSCKSNFQQNQLKGYRIRINDIIIAFAILITFIIQFILSVNYFKYLE